MWRLPHSQETLACTLGGQEEAEGQENQRASRPLLDNPRLYSSQDPTGASLLPWLSI